jgi:uncharacterized oligopeptide transporter (OPT) family protein
MENNSSSFNPYISASDFIPEFKPKAVILKVFFGILFVTATVCLGLKVGLTLSASIPIAVLSISILKKIGKATILENNLVQTIGSAEESKVGLVALLSSDLITGGAITGILISALKGCIWVTDPTGLQISLADKPTAGFVESLGSAGDLSYCFFFWD